MWASCRPASAYSPLSRPLGDSGSPPARFRSAAPLWKSLQVPSVVLVDVGQTANPAPSSAGPKAEARTLHVRLLGGMDVRYGTERLDTLESPRLQSLLAYLLLHREASQQRRHLAFLLWPDSTEAQARTNLRQLLHHLRHAIPHSDNFLDVDATCIQWRSEGPSWLDVAEFEQAAGRADADDAGSREALEHAAALYGGDLLPECYDEWILPEREALRDRNIELLERLTSILEQERDYQAGARYSCLSGAIRFASRPTGA